ncbi:MAG: MMPL family transporter [bacterium]
MDLPGNVARSFSKWVIRYRWLLLGAGALISAGLIYAIRNLAVNNDYDNWLPENDKVSRLYRQVDRQFSSTAIVFVILDCTKDGVFHPGSLALVKRLTEALQGVEELFNVTSLTNVPDFRRTDAGLAVGDLIPEIPASPSDLDALERYVLSREMYVNTLVSENAAYTVVVANVEGGSIEAVTAAKVLRTVQAIAGDHPYYFGGDPALQMYADIYMAQDLRVLIPVTLLVMVAILFFSFAGFWGVVLPLGIVFLCILWTLGLQALAGLTANILTPAVVVLLIALGSDYAVHIYNHYLRQGDIELCIQEMTFPVVMSALTTIAGLLTFLTTRISLFSSFGIDLAIGLGAACLLSLLLLPVCVYLLRIRPAPIVHGAGAPEHVLSRWLGRLGLAVHRRPKTTLAIVLVLLAATGAGFQRMTTNVDYVELMPEDSPPRVGGDLLRDHFSGFYPVSVYFQGDMEEPAVMQMMSYVENYFRSYEMVGAFRSVNDWIAEENWLLNGVFAVPETREQIANLWLLMEGREILKTFVAPDRRQSLVTALVKEPRTGVMQQIAVSLWRFIDSDLADEVVEVDPALLAPDGRNALEQVRLADAARQLAWLSAGYDKPRKYDPNRFHAALTRSYPQLDRRIGLEPVWQAGRSYLEQEALEALPAALVDRVVDLLKSGWQDRRDPAFRDRIETLLLSSRTLTAEDARATASGLLNRAEATLRIERASGLLDSLAPLLPSGFEQKEELRKRAAGVLWRLWAEHPVFFASQVVSVPGIEGARIATRPLKIQQAGFPDLVRRLYELLHVNLIQSLFLASLGVLVLISLSQLSLRRGLVSLVTVLVPIGSILGLMGWAGIPLDFGTSLAGALIIGLGVDGCIHFLHHYHRLCSGGIPAESALRDTMRHIGKGIVTANATTFCGFLVLLLSKTSVLRNFGLVNAMAIFLVTASILTLLPAFVSLLTESKAARFRGRPGAAGSESAPDERKAACS